MGAFIVVGDFYFSVKEMPVVPDVSDSDIYAFIKEKGDYYAKVTDDTRYRGMPYVDVITNLTSQS